MQSAVKIPAVILSVAVTKIFAVILFVKIRVNSWQKNIILNPRHQRNPWLNFSAQNCRSKLEKTPKKDDFTAKFLKKSQKNRKKVTFLTKKILPILTFSRNPVPKGNIHH